jgi:putative oxidoreductase
MARGSSEPKLLHPGLSDFYDSWNPIAYTLVRVVIGCILFMHGWGKFQLGAAAVAANIMGKNGLEPALVFAYAAMFLETIGAACIILGLLTRFFAAALAIEMAIGLIFVHFHNGFAVAKGGYEYILLIGIVMFAIAIRGGGPYSLDAKIGKEL